MSEKDVVLKANIEVFMKLDESNTEWFRGLPGPEQAEALTALVKEINAHLREGFSVKDEVIINTDLTEVPVWPK